MDKTETKTQKIEFLSGKRVYLRPLEKEDLPNIQRWANDPEIRRLSGEVSPMNSANAEAFFTRVLEDRERAWFVVVVREGDRPIGEAGLLRMFPAWRATDLSIVLGEKDAWGQGYGREAIQLLLEYAFCSLNFHRVAIGVVGINENAIRFYEKVGFKQEGLQRDGYFYAGQYHDFVMMSLLEEDYWVSKK